jgi:hypothetical protein
MILKLFGVNILTNMKQHKVRKHSWKNGVLETVEHMLPTLQSAMDFCLHHSNHRGVDTIKVVTMDGEVVHSINLTSAKDTITNTYA